MAVSEPNIVVEPRPDGRWAVQTDGTRRAYRVVDRQADAERIARESAKRRGAELIVKGADGRIERRDSHGADRRDRTG
jgi:hypothetical protein